jgi:hypothetical protein
VIFATYCFGIGAIGFNIVRSKLQNDLEEKIRALREYDLSTDKIRPDQVDDKDVIVLLKSSNSDVIMSQQIPYANLLDTTRYFMVSSRIFDLSRRIEVITLK